MMKIEDAINDIVLVVLREEGLLTDVGIGSNKFYSRIVGYDEFGVWLEHPNFEIMVSEDAEGKPLPPGEVKRERFDASIHLPWQNLSTIVHFPKREGFDFPSPFERKIGFPTEEKKG